MLELLWPLEQLPTDDGAWAVRAVDACTQLARFARLVSGEDYAHILAASRLRRLLHTHVDWTLGVTTTTVGEHAGARGWRDILVVGAQPARASGHACGFMSAGGYGTDKLRGVRRSRHPETILKAMLADWLHANGYVRTASAVDATVAAALAAVQRG